MPHDKHGCKLISLVDEGRFVSGVLQPGNLVQDRRAQFNPPAVTGTLEFHLFLGQYDGNALYIRAKVMADEGKFHVHRRWLGTRFCPNAATMDSESVTGIVRITTTDTILQGLVLPVLKNLVLAHPLITARRRSGC
ncbi:MAG: hypothetical protein V4632_17735 [Pseudomonadota bacterium]